MYISQKNQLHHMLGLKKCRVPKETIFQASNANVDFKILYYPKENLYRALLFRQGRIFLSDTISLYSHYKQGLLSNILDLLHFPKAAQFFGHSNLYWLKAQVNVLL